MKFLLTWKNRRISWLVFLVIVLAFFGASFLPIRFFVAIGLLKKFHRGSSFYKRRYYGNREAALIELTNFFKTRGVIEGSVEEWLCKPWTS